MIVVDSPDYSCPDLSRPGLAHIHRTPDALGTRHACLVAQGLFQVLVRGQRRPYDIAMIVQSEGIGVSRHGWK